MNDPVLSAVGGLLTDIEASLGESHGVPTRAVVVAEFIDEDGDRRLRIIRDGQITTWDARGMLATVLSDMAAFDVADVLEGE